MTFTEAIYLAIGCGIMCVILFLSFFIGSGLFLVITTFLPVGFGVIAVLIYSMFAFAILLYTMSNLSDKYL